MKAQYPNVEIIQRGQGERSTKAIASMKINLLILFVIMILIISLSFRSVYQGLLIMLVIPAGVAGGILGHSLIGIPVSILSAFGMIALIGILVNDAIVFLDQYNRNILDGMSIQDSVAEAAKSRFRPIMLTSVTTVAGMMPLIMETSFQAQFLIPMAASISFGILFGTIFILLFFPAIILVSADFRRAWNHILNDEKNPLLGILKMNATMIIYILAIPLSPLVVLFPNMLFSRLLGAIWTSPGMRPAVESEPALLNHKKEEERTI